ncbi:MAG: DUF2959 domain-containing protein [Gammaproteobacteria bacterium HGW-Gammaproteobacteria-10]|nr:MAG: DUF2959 domain-containing protein [Gammaproteobacteria bacterium HGW-Gammaproteobacteria-10]
MADNNLTRKTLNSVGRLVSKLARQAYYQAKESMGYPKRDMVVRHVEQACSSLQETKIHFESALERFKTIVVVDDSTLESKYRLLQQQYDFCKAKADEVGCRVRAIEEVTGALFAEWEAEIDEYSNRSLKTKSRQQLRQSQQHYAKLIKTMHRAESKISPVLAAFKDQVLFLKHNLNAQAITAIEHEFIEISMDMTQLVQAMEQTIFEANRFISGLVEQKALPAA